MALQSFRLLVGKHQGRDNSVEKPDNAPDNWRPPTKDYTAGQIVKSESDLVAQFGKEKFERVQGKARRGVEEEEDKERDMLALPAKKMRTVAVAPNGQVSTGKQVATTDNKGRTVSGIEPVDDDDEEGQEMASRTGRNPEDFKKGNSPRGGKRGQSSEEDTEDDKAKLEGMTKAELLEYAKDHEIDGVGSAMTKADILDAILSSNDEGQPVTSRKGTNDDDDDEEDEEESK